MSPASSPDFEEDEVRIQALLDGELSDIETAALRRRIAESPGLQASEQQLRTLIGDVTHLMASVARECVAAPAATLAVPVVSGRRPRSWWSAPVLRAAAIACLALGALVAVGSKMGSWMAETHGSLPDRVASGLPNQDSLSVDAGNAARPHPVPTGSPSEGRVASTAPRRTTTHISPATSAPPSAVARDADVSIQATGMRRVASRQQEGGSGSYTYALGASTVVLDYGTVAVAEGGVAVSGPLSTPDPGTGTVRTEPQPGVAALGEYGIGARAPGDPLCPQGIRWRDATGTELRLSGPYTCHQLQRLAARFRVQQ